MKKSNILLLGLFALILILTLSSVAIFGGRIRDLIQERRSTTAQVDPV